MKNTIDFDLEFQVFPSCGSSTWEAEAWGWQALGLDHIVSLLQRTSEGWLGWSLVWSSCLSTQKQKEQQKSQEVTSSLLCRSCQGRRTSKEQVTVAEPALLLLTWLLLFAFLCWAHIFIGLQLGPVRGPWRGWHRGAIRSRPPWRKPRRGGLRATSDT